MYQNAPLNLLHFFLYLLYVVIRGGSRNEEKGGTLLLAGDSVHSASSMGSRGVPPPRKF